MIASLLTSKEHVVYLTESDNCATALDLLEDKALRCAPVLDETGALYRGNIYRYHIYQHFYHHPDTPLHTLPVTHFLKNTTRVVREDASFFQLFFTMVDLPYVAVLNSQNTFLGIVRHNRLLDFCAQAWSMENTRFILSVDTIGNIGELSKVSKLINRYCDISTAITMEQTTYDPHASILFALSDALDPVQLHQLVRYLERRHYRVTTYRLR